LRRFLETRRRQWHFCGTSPTKRSIEVDEATATMLESRAAERGMSVSEIVAEMTVLQSAPIGRSADELAELDRRWAER
jgi:hypothetical protein